MIGCGGDDDVTKLDASTVDAGATPDLGAPADARAADAEVSRDAAMADGGAPLATAGLALRQQYPLPIPSGHLGEMNIHGDLAYIANSWDSFATIALEPDGSIVATQARPPEEPRSRCTTLAVHDPSRTLYCTSDESERIASYDLTDPRRPLMTDANALRLTVPNVRDALVVGDDLFLAQFERGLWVAPIDAAGLLDTAIATAVTGNVRFIAADAGHLVVLTADRGLLVLDGTGAAVTVAHALPLDGTPQDLSVRGDRAVVALGSAGAAVIDLRGTPTVIARVLPQAVVTGADLESELLAVTTLTGAYLYDLSVTPPRLAGYSASGHRSDRAGGVMLSGRFAGGELITSDWIFVERFAASRSGEVRELDLPRGLYLPPGAGVRIPLRNEGELAFDVAVRVGDARIDLSVGADATVYVPIEAAALASLLAERGILVEMVSAGSSSTVQIPVLFRPTTSGPPSSHPASGDVFPELRLAAPMGVASIPMVRRRSLLVFFARDCAAMWPVLEDAAYLGARGALDDGARPFLVTESDIAADGYVARWALGAADVGHHGYLAPRAVVEFNGSERVYEDRFFIDELPRAASHPTNYLIDASGIVEVVDSYYRGAFPLRYEIAPAAE